METVYVPARYKYIIVKVPVSLKEHVGYTFNSIDENFKYHLRKKFKRSVKDINRLLRKETLVIERVKTHEGYYQQRIY